MSVYDTLAASRDAAIELSHIESRGRMLRDAIGVHGHTYDVHPKNGILDPMRRVVDLVAWEDESRGAEALRLTLDDGAELVRGASVICDHLGVEVLRRYYLQGEPMEHIAADVGPRVKELADLEPHECAKVLEGALRGVVRDLEDAGVARLRQLARSSQD